LIFDADQHLYEEADMYQRYVDPSKRHFALRIEPDDLGYWWVVMPWQGGVRTHYAWIGTMGNYDPIDRHIRIDRANGVRSSVDYRRDLPASYSQAEARVAALDRLGIDRTVLLPQHGIQWLQRGGRNLLAVRANLEAWNRKAVEIQHDGCGRLFPTGHITLRGGDQEWAIGQLSHLAEGGVRACVVPHTLADGRPPSHPDHDRTWSAFEDLGIVPVTHIIEGEMRPSNLPEEWFETDTDHILSTLEIPFVHVGIELALADLILHGVFDRHPGLRIAVIELGGLWYPRLARLGEREGRDRLAVLARPPSEYVRDRLAISPGPALKKMRPIFEEFGADRFMFGSDWGHCEGLADPLRDYRELVGSYDRGTERRLYGDNVAELLGVER
jgi:predicted TIM-barrel fold metal-dependent hydrolase